MTRPTAASEPTPGTPVSKRANTRRIRVYVEISDYVPLDHLISTLSTIREGLPDGAEPELRMRGDDEFGRVLSIGYFRELTDEEAALEDRYAKRSDACN